MEKVREVERKQKLEKVSFLKISLFVLLGIGLVLIKKDNTSLYLIFPYVSICFYLGGIELFSCIVGLLLGSYINSFNELVVVLIGLVMYFLLLIISKILPIKMKNRLILTSFLSDIFIRYFVLYLNNSNFQIESVLLSISMMLVTYTLLNYCTSFLSSKKFFHPYFLVFVGGVLCLFYELVPHFFVDIKHILILSTIILISVVGGSGVGIFTTVGMIIISYLFNNELNLTLWLFWITNSFVSSLFNKSKPSLLLVNLVSCLFIIYLSDFDVSKYNYLIEFLASYLLVMFIPNRIIKRLKKKFISHNDMLEYQEVNYRRLHEKISQKIGRIFDAYVNLKNKLSCENEINLEKRRLEIMYSSLCKMCPKNHICHVEKRNKNEQIALSLLHQDLSYDERLYLENNCLKPSYFVNEGYLQRAYFESEIKYELEYNKLKQSLVDNLSGITSSLEQLKIDFENETGLLINGMEKNISLLLEQINLDPIFVNYKDDYLNETMIEIGLRINNKLGVEELIKTKLEDYLHKPLKIDKLKTMPYENYLRITYKAFKNYHISFGIAQISKDELYCGDSYTSFSYNNEKYFVISDGMGYGKEAYEESKSTIDSFRQIVETGVKPSIAIKTINSILKIRHKNDFFSTLDILKINEIDYVASITKTCAPSTYLFRDNEIKEIDSFSLPVGIVEDVEAYDNVIDIKKEDIFVMSSDGFKLTKEEIEDFIKLNQDLPSQQLCEKLIGFSKKDVVNDDVTLFVIKVI